MKQVVKAIMSSYAGHYSQKVHELGNVATITVPGPTWGTQMQGDDKKKDKCCVNTI